MSEKLLTAEAQLLEKDNELKTIAKKLQLESKRCKHYLHVEQQKTKDAMLKLEKTRAELISFRKLEELQVKYIKASIMR